MGLKVTEHSQKSVEIKCLRSVERRRKSVQKVKRTFYKIITATSRKVAGSIPDGVTGIFQ